MDFNYLFASLVWGTIGLGYLSYGKKQGASVFIIGGLALLGLSYFVKSPLSMSFLSLILIGAMYWLNRLF
ncbi:MAG TPA: hypothetical protein V6C82_04190 [Chroococcales cyanobacterium]